MAYTTKDLLLATWRGVPFYVRSESMPEAGRRVILHDYPNSDTRYVEDMGKLPSKFQIEAFVITRDAADKLEKALNTPGQGRLTMPVFGAVTLFSLPYSKDASQTSVGEISFTLGFIEGETSGDQAESEYTIEKVYASGDSARAAIGNELESKWIPPWNYATSAIAQFDLTTVLDSVIPLSTIVSNATDFTQACGYVQLNIAAAIQTAKGLRVTLIDNLMQTISECLDNGNGLTPMVSLSELEPSETSPVYGGPVWDETTETRKALNSNRNAMFDATKLSALVTCYEQAAGTTYSTVEEIEEIRSTIEERYSDLMSGYRAREVRKSIQDTRIAALSIMSRQEQAIYATVDIKVNAPVPALILSYRLYGDTSYTDTIRALNPGQSSVGLSGTIKVLQA